MFEIVLGISMHQTVANIMQMKHDVCGANVMLCDVGWGDIIEFSTDNSRDNCFR